MCLELFVQMIVCRSVFRRGPAWGLVLPRVLVVHPFVPSACGSAAPTRCWPVSWDLRKCRKRAVRVRLWVWPNGCALGRVSDCVCEGGGPSHPRRLTRCPGPRPWPGLRRLPTGHDHAAPLALLVLSLLLHAAHARPGQPGELVLARGCVSCACLSPCVHVTLLSACVSVWDAWLRIVRVSVGFARAVCVISVCIRVRLGQSSDARSPVCLPGDHRDGGDG